MTPDHVTTASAPSNPVESGWTAPTDAPTGFRLGYRPWLDGMRGLAVFLVLIYHFKLVSGGFLGVDVFFVLSGFLITSLLIEEWQRHRSISLPRFYLRRALRLLPAFFALLLAFYFCARLFRPASELPGIHQELLVAACYVANWPTLHQVPMGTLGHTWSLSLEEQFYLLWPALLYLMLRWRCGRRTLVAAVCLGIVGSCLLRFTLHRWHRMDDAANVGAIMRLYAGLDTRADALLSGCLVGLLAAWNLLPTSRRFVFWTGILSLACVPALGVLILTRHLGHPQLHDGLFTIVALMVALILVRLLSAPSFVATHVLESAVLVGLGRLSYALYLYHIPIFFWVNSLALNRYAEIALASALTFAAALLSYLCIERPCLRWKSRLGASSAIPVSSAPPLEIGSMEAPPRAA